MIPGPRREVAGEPLGDRQSVIVAHLPDDPGAIVQPPRQAVIVEQLRVAGLVGRRTAVEDSGKRSHPFRHLRLDAHAGYRDRRRRPACRQVGSFDRRPAERPVDEEIIGLAIEEFRVGGLLSDLEIERAAPERLFDVSLIQTDIRPRLDLADGREIADIVARQPAAIDPERVGVERRARPARNLLKVGIDGKIEATEMDCARLDAAPGVDDVVRVVSRTERDALLG